MRHDLRPSRVSRDLLYNELHLKYEDKNSLSKLFNVPIISKLSNLVLDVVHVILIYTRSIYLYIENRLKPLISFKNKYSNKQIFCKFTASSTH